MSGGVHAMATPKRPSEPSPKGRPASRSLRDQMASLAPEVVTAAAARVAPPPPPKPARPNRLDALSFKDLAGNGGVRPLPEPARASVRPEPPPVVAPRPEPPKHRLWVERRDDVVRARAEDAPPRWLDDMRAGRMVPRRELDLHRKAAAEARQTLDEEIARARRENIGCLLIVCGRGLHSGIDGPVLPDVAIERLSEELADHVLAFSSAPRKWGGDGALLVLLRPPAKD
jgi:DNA-nicking Smr family endonuclease